MSLIRNRHAYNSYEILEKFEAGIKLKGFEVKAIKEGKAHLTGSYIKMINNEAWLINCKIAKYSKTGTLYDFDEIREKKILLHKKEISKLSREVSEKNYTIVPLKMYLKGHLIKLSVGLAKGKTKIQKKGDLIRKQQARQQDRMLKNITK